MPATPPPRLSADGSVASLRQAATVLLLRQGADGPEVLLLRRSGRAGFAADAWVFPGGVVDDGDARLDGARWQGIDPAALAERFAADPALVLAFHVAAVRETFEEAGVLLATDAEGGVPAADDDDVRSARRALNDRTLDSRGFADWLAHRGLVLDLGALTYLSRWVTPTAEPRRYDTAFFLASAPADQIAASDLTETTEHRWVRPAQALAEHRDGQLHLIYPTIKTLEGLADATTCDELVRRAAAQPAVRPLLPHLWVDDDGRYVGISHPDDAEYPHHLYEG